MNCLLNMIYQKPHKKLLLLIAFSLCSGCRLADKMANTANLLPKFNNLCQDVSWNVEANSAHIKELQNNIDVRAKQVTNEIWPWVVLILGMQFMKFFIPSAVISETIGGAFHWIAGTGDKKLRGKK